MIKAFFNIWSKYVVGNKEDFLIGLNQLEHEIRLDERIAAIDKYTEELKAYLRKFSVQTISDKDFDYIANTLKKDRTNE